MHLDRQLTVDTVAKRINDARGSGKLQDYPTNHTPSRAIWVDPDDVMLVENDGHYY